MPRMLKDLLARLRIRLGADGAEIVRLHDDLEGQILLEESAFLFRAARAPENPGSPRTRTIVEIGSFRGKSCVMLARGGGESCRITAIDPHIPPSSLPSERYTSADHVAFLDAIARHGVTGRVDPWVMTSREASARWDGQPIDLLWVDGDHTYDAVRFDLEAWSPRVRVGGMLAAHDCRKGSDVERAWREVIGSRPEMWAPRGKARSIAWTTRLT